MENNNLKEFYGPRFLKKYDYPSYPELRCDSCTGGRRHQKESLSKYGAFKNGVKYDCNCDLIHSPYSFPYEAFTDKTHQVCPLHNQFSDPPFPPKPKLNVMAMFGASANKLQYKQKLLNYIERSAWALLIFIVLLVTLGIFG